MKVDLYQYRMMKFSDLDVFVRSDPERWRTFTRMLNEHLQTLRPGVRLYVTDLVKPKSYNATVKWFCWRCFLTSAHPIEIERKQFVRYEMAPDYSYITAISIK